MERAKAELEMLYADGEYVKIEFDYEVGQGMYVLETIRRLREPEYFGQVITALRGDPGIEAALELMAIAKMREMQDAVSGDVYDGGGDAGGSGTEDDGGVLPLGHGGDEPEDRAGERD